MSGKLGLFPLHSANRQTTECLVQFTTVNGDNPSGQLKPGSYITSIARTGEGVVLVTLSQKWNHIYPFVSAVLADDANHVTITGLVTGQSSTNTVEITTGSSSGTADDIPGSVVSLLLKMDNEA